MAPRIKLSQRIEVPLYALGGYVLCGSLLCIGTIQDVGTTTRAPFMFGAIAALLAGAVIHILDRITAHAKEMLAKIDDSVGGVWDAGEQAGVRHERLRAVAAPLAVVRDLSPH